MSFCRPMLARVASQKPRRPQFVGIAEVLGLAAGERDQPCLGLGGDRRLLARPRTIVERRHRTIGQRPLDAALDGLMMHPQSPTHRKERRVFPVGQQHPRPLDPARRLRSRAGNRAQRRQILLANRQFDRPPQPRHDLKTRFRIKAARLQAMSGKMNPAHMSKYPPAKPGALGLWPLEAAVSSLTRLYKGWPLRRAARGDADAAPSKSSA